MYIALGSDAELVISKAEFDSIRAGSYPGAISAVFKGGLGAVCKPRYTEGTGFNSHCVVLVLPSAGFGYLALHDTSNNEAEVGVMLETGVVLDLALHLCVRRFAFRQQSSGAFVYLDSSNQEAYPETAMHNALQQPPTLGTSHDVFVQLLNLLDATPNGGEGEQCYFLFKSGSKDILKATGYEAGRAARLSARGDMQQAPAAPRSSASTSNGSNSIPGLVAPQVGMDISNDGIHESPTCPGSHNNWD